MKALRTTLAAVILFVGAITVNAQSMSIAAMRSNARFLTDRMAYTLGINDPFLIDEIYRINYDYIWGVNEYLDDVALGYYYDDYMAVVAARDAALRNLLGVRLWNRIVNYSYFYRPIVFANHGWRFSIYDYDRYGVNRFYYHAPRPLVTYTGGHFFRGMTPRRGRMVAPPRDMGPRGGIAPRGGAPVPNNGPYRGAAPRPGRMNDMAPRMNGNVNNNVSRPATPNTNVNVNRNTNTNTNVNVNRNVNVNVNRPATPSTTTTPNINVGANRHEIRTNANASTNAGSSMRSGSNINSSSRFNAPTRSSATPSTGTRSSAGASMGTRSSAGASMGTRSGGAAVGGRTGGGRR